MPSRYRKEQFSLFADFLTLSNTQLIINVLSIAAFLMSAFLSISKFVSQRRNIKIVIYDYAQPLGTVQFFIHFQNMASSNISIQSISIIENEREYPCELIPKKIRGAGSELLKSAGFPIFLCQDQGYLCFLEFVSCQDIQLAPGKTVALRIYSNHGPIDRSVTLGNTSHYLHIRQ